VTDESEVPEFDPRSQLDLSMTNYDQSIDDGLAEALQASEEVFTAHYGSNFCGTVWFADGKFWEAVYVFHELQQVISAESLPDLMKAVNDKYGWG